MSVSWPSLGTSSRRGMSVGVIETIPPLPRIIIKKLGESSSSPGQIDGTDKLRAPLPTRERERPLLPAEAQTNRF